MSEQTRAVAHNPPITVISIQPVEEKPGQVGLIVACPHQANLFLMLDRNEAEAFLERFRTALDGAKGLLKKEGV